MRKRILLLFCFLIFMSMGVIFAQTIKISGEVRDSSSSPIGGASVQIKGENRGTITNSQGNFSINAENGETLIISAVGFSTKAIIVTNNTNYTITLSPAESNLSDIVVTTALGIKRQAKELGYSTAHVNSAKLNQGAVVNAATGLAAKVSGVDIRLADNGVNPQVKVTFRGSRSIEGDNEALIVVDGIPVDQTYLANLNPTDIEDVTILKGSNSAALYGMAASNGVMNITTKKGKGKFSLTYENIASFESISYFPKLQGEYSLYGGEYSDPFSGQPLFIPYENESYGPAYNSLDPELGPNAQFGHGDSIPIGVNGNQQLVYGPYKNYPNGRKDFFQTGFGDQNKLSGSFGGKWGGIYVSGEHTSKHGVVPNDTYDRSGSG